MTRKHRYQAQMKTQESTENQINFVYAVTEVTNKYNNVKIETENTEIT